ncbi:hypothetical protein ABKA04_008705 [Annulohypoxylon sp. FPYF3050]
MASKNVVVAETSSAESIVEAPKLPDKFADESYKLFSQVKVEPPTPEEAARIRRKSVKWILSFLCVGYHLMYVDKQTLGSSSILGILEDGHLNTTQYNWLASIFYLGYLLAEWPQNWALQRFPVAKWLAGNLIVCFSSWKWFMVITGTLTIIYGIFVWFFFPDNPMSAHFLTLEERAQAILRISSNHSGIEQKRFKKHQLIEALKDPKTWLFFLHSWSQEMANGLTSQYSLIIKSFGFTTLQTTLLGCVTGLTSLVSLGAAAIILAKTRNSRAWISAAAYIPPMISSILLIALPWSNRWGLLSAIWIRSTGGIPYSVVMIWAANCSAGHTKKTAVIALYHVGYGLGNILSPQLFQEQYKPRYIVTWWVILWIACVLPTFIVLYLRWYLVKENKRRDLLAQQGAIREIGVIEHIDEDGERREEVVDARQLDLTDRENLAFRYVL